MTKDPDIFLIHIAKTGGTFLKSVIRDTLGVQKNGVQQTVNGNLVLLNHVSLDEIAKSYGKIEKMAFVFRNPTDRFLSGFHCRLRMGQPDHNVLWDAREAAAFGFFKSANELAESLFSEDDLTRSAAHYSMSAIRHLRRGYGFHFGKQTDFILNEIPKIVACTDIKNLDKNMGEFLRQINVGVPKEIGMKFDRARVQYPKDLSPKAEANLKEFWQTEYEYYEIFKGLEAHFFKG